ncbi:MAG TPA: hypothetical protein VGM91_10705 [Conexibacter sp.]|jgi:hypothetical protein
MISATELAQRVSRLLDAEVETATFDDRISLLTPAEYPDGGGVVVFVEPYGNGFLVSDRGTTEASLVGYVNERRLSESAANLAHRFGVRFEQGRVEATCTNDELEETCWRVALAAAAIGAADAFLRPPRSENTFARLVADALSEGARVERNRRLSGASGHEHRVSIFLPKTHTIIEPIGGEEAWRTARLVYAEFGDLSQVNGYRFHAVLDDRSEPGRLEDEERLLVQKGQVARWSDHGRWLAGLVSGN